MDIPSSVIGICLGALIGVITGAIFIYMLKSLSKAAVWLDGVKIVAEMLSIPTFWFGGPWVATKVLLSVQWQHVLPWYIALLAILFLVIATIPMLRFVVRMATETEGP